MWFCWNALQRFYLFSTGGVPINITYKLKQIITGVPLMDDGAKCMRRELNYSFVPPARTVPGILTEENHDMESELEETCGLITTRVRLFPGLAPIRTCSEVAEQPQGDAADDNDL